MLNAVSLFQDTLQGSSPANGDRLQALANKFETVIWNAADLFFHAAVTRGADATND
jgi:hypothetical protein